jgi:drug/metabolite transporter (DMT)-like permease
LDPSAVALVLLAAALHAGWNAVLRVGGDRLVVMGVITGGAGLIAGLLVPFTPLPPTAAWPILLLSAGFHVGYNSFLVAAYAHGDLGQVYPIARGTAPLLVVGLVGPVLGESVAGVQLAGVLLTSAGIAALALRGGASRVRPQALAYALVTACFIAAYTVTDAAGARAAGSPHGYTLWLFLVDGVLFVAIVVWRRGRALAALARESWRPGLAGGAMSLAAYWLVIWAFTVAPAAGVAALRETSVLFAALIGAFLLKEPLGRWRVAAAGVVTAGVLLLRS